MWHDIEQNCDEWLALRAGKITGSAIGKIMANYGKAFGDPAKDLAVNLVVEQLTGKPQESGYSNEHMERGHAEEPVARMMYEDTHFVDVLRGGFYDNGQTGCSPDGRVCADGIIEIKSVIAPVHFATLKRDGMDPKYKWQCVFNLRESGRDWIGYVSYCSTFPLGKRLYVKRYHKADFAEEFGMIDVRLNEFYKLMAETKRIIEWRM